MMEEMTLAEAFKKADDDDIVINESFNEVYRCNAREIHKMYMPGLVAVSESWRIVKSVQKVLTAEESLRKWHNTPSEIDEDFKNGFLYGHKIGHQNGRLERDLQLKKCLKERWDGVEIINTTYFWECMGGEND